MKKTLLALASLFVASTAFAADLPRKSVSYAPVALPVGMNWSGFYAGLQVGYGSLKFSSNYVNPAETGIFGGVRAGYDWQFGRFVAGIYGDLNTASLKGNNSGVPAVGDTLYGKASMLGDFNLRAGYLVMPNALVYALIGSGYVANKTNNFVSGVTTIATSTTSGLNLGLGAEYRFTQNWSAFGEYTYTKFSNASVNRGTVGVNYRF